MEESIHKQKMRRVVITGMGIYSCIGKNQDEVKDSLFQGRSGIGIDPADIPRLGERGFTGYNGRLDKKSTGIGLYLCKEISRRLSHTLTIESKPGKGTRVTIDFATRQLQAE